MTNRHFFSQSARMRIKPLRTVIATLAILATSAVFGQTNCSTGACPIGGMVPISIPSQPQRGYVGGEATQQQYPMVCVVTVRGPSYNGMRQDTKGSGVYVVDGGVPIVLTAAHLFRDNPGGDVFAQFQASHQTIQGTLVARDDAADAAAIRLVQPPRVAPATVATDQPAPGETLTLTGFAATSGFTARSCTALRVANNGTGMYASAVAQSGCSGGPVWNSRGQVAGLIVGHNTQETLVVTGRRRCGLLRWLIPTQQTVVRQTTTAQRYMPVCPPQPQPQLVCPPSYAPATAAPPARPATPSTPDVIPVPEPTQAAIDYDKIIDEVMKRIEDKLPQEQPPIDYTKIAELTVARLKADPSFRGPPGVDGKDGTPGKDGRDGKDGTNGKDGVSPTLDVAALAAAIRAQLPGITVRTIDGNGSVLDVENIPLGGTLNIHHRPK